jgi:hypothetical protein
MTANLYSYQAWLNYYHSQAAQLPYAIKAHPASLKSTLQSISRTALDARAEQLRQSDSYTNKKWKTAAAGLIPFLKIGVSIDACEEFADEALQAFGLSDARGLKEIARTLKKATSGRDDLAMDVLKTLGKLTVSELLAHTGMNAASEGLHIKPVIGQVASSVMGYKMVRKRMIKIIERSRSVAGDVHANLLIPMVVETAR